VLVIWQAAPLGAAQDEGGRALFAAWSRDEGGTFAPETTATARPTGACACCGLDAAADRTGAFHIAFRGAVVDTNRALLLLTAPRAGASFTPVFVHDWFLSTCPMSTASVLDTPAGPLAAWETREQVFFARLAPDRAPERLIEAPGSEPKRKHPVVAANGRGEVLLAWTEGAGWEQGGAVAWQVYDRHGRPTSVKGRADGLPVWGLVAAFAQADGRFVLVFKTRNLKLAFPPCRKALRAGLPACRFAGLSRPAFAARATGK
jgi:hypothetical protein